MIFLRGFKWTKPSRAAHFIVSSLCLICDLCWQIERRTAILGHKHLKSNFVIFKSDFYLEAALAGNRVTSQRHFFSIPVKEFEQEQSCVYVAGGSGCIWGVTADFQHIYFIFFYFIFSFFSFGKSTARAHTPIYLDVHISRVDHEQTLCGQSESFGDRGGPEAALRREEASRDRPGPAQIRLCLRGLPRPELGD